MIEIINVAPRENWPLAYYGASNPRHNDDAPTVADYTPNATEPLAPSSADDKNFSYGKLWRAYVQDKSLLLEM